MQNLTPKLIILIALAVILIPLAALPTEQKAEQSEKRQENISSQDNVKNAAAKPKSEGKLRKKIRLYNHLTGKIEVLKIEEYLFGVVSAECPMSYNAEALRAQIVAAHTYTLYLADKNAASKYDVSSDAKVCQAYITRKTALENWGNMGAKYEKQLDGLIDEMIGRVITYKSKPIFAAYHAISAGKTEDAENVWGNEVAYLRPVESGADKLAKSYLYSKSFPFSKLEKALSPLKITSDELKTAKLERSESGNVLKIIAGKKEISGGDFSAALDLRSNNFELSFSTEGLTVTTRGYGHQVGMSQNGANYLAAQGSSYEEILLHYYSGVKIEDFSF